MMRRFLISAAVIATALWVASAGAEESIRAVSFIPKNHPVMEQANVWVNTINEALAGKLKINYVGGSEVIGRYQQQNALRTGVIDMTLSTVADFQDEIPEVSTFTLSKIGPAEERKSGFYEKNPGRDMAVKQLTNKPPTENSKGLRFGNYVQGREVIEEELEAVFAGKKDAKTALNEAVKRGNEVLRKFQAANK